MKKGTKLVALLLGLALMVPACTPGANPSKSSQEPGTSSEAPVNYKVTISNKEELQAEWFVGDPSRKVNIEVEPKANITQLVNEGKIQITSSDPAKLAVEGQMASPVAAGEATITVKCGESEDTVKVTLQAKQTVKEKYGVNHEGTAEDPFDNEDACKVAKHEKYNNEDFYVKGKVSSFYYAPGSRTSGEVAFYLTPAEGKTEKFEVFKCFKDKEQKQPLTDDDIWVGGEVTAHGPFTVYNNTQAETSSAIFVKCEGTKPQPRQTLTKTFAEVLAVGNALQDSGSTWDYYKFQGYVTVKSGNDYFLTATKGEALVPGKSDKDHGERDIKGTNAIELYGAGKVAELAAKLLEGAKVEVTMIVKNYHGTIENGLDLKDADVTVLEAGTQWAVPEPAVANKTVTEFIALENNKKNAYTVKATIKAFKSGDTKDEYGNMTITDGTSDVAIYGASATATALAWDGAGEYAFTNPKDFLTNETTSALKVGDEITMKLIRADYIKDGVTKAIQGTGIITAVTPGGGEGGEGGGGGEQTTYTKVADLSYNKDTTVVINNELTDATDPKITYTSVGGVSIVVRKNTSSSDVNVWKADYASCRWYVGHKVTISHANDFDRIVFTCDSNYNAFKPTSDSSAKTIAALEAAGITYTAADGKITLDFSAAVKTFDLVPDKQIRPSLVELYKKA